MEKLKIWDPEEEKKKKIRTFDRSRLDLSGERPEVNVTDMFRGIDEIEVCHNTRVDWEIHSDVKHRCEVSPYHDDSWLLRYDDEKFIEEIRWMDMNECGEIENIDVLLRMYRLCPEYLDDFQIDLLRIAASVKQVLDMNDIDIILSDLKNCKRLHDPRAPKDRGTDQPLFRTDEQKLTIIQALQVEDLFFHKGAPKEEYPYEFVIAFRRKIDDAVVEVWITVPLYLVNEDKTISVDVSFYRD